MSNQREMPTSPSIDPRDPATYGQPAGGDRYRAVLARRARRELPEMESSKAVVRRIAAQFQQGDRILDVGCGVGHYLVGLIRELGGGFDYVGIDVSPDSIATAREIFADEEKVSFEVGNVFDLDVAARSFDLVMANNVLLHLPEIETPIRQLLHAADRYVCIRTLVGDRSFRVKDVHEPEAYDAQGEPENFAFYNIYSRDYVTSLVAEAEPGARLTITEDVEFDPERISAAAAEHGSAKDATTLVGRWQTNGYLLLPWAMLEIFR